MEAKELCEKIREFETKAGESFTDYYMHDNVKDTSWAFWLLGRGFTEHANIIIDEILAGETCIDQDTLYDVYPEYDEIGDWVKGSYEKNAMLWAEFLVATPYYLNSVNEFLKKQENED